MSGIHIGEVLFRDKETRERIAHMGGSRVRLLTRLYHGQDLGSLEAFCYASHVGPHQVLTRDEINWETSGIPAVAKEEG